MNIGKGKTQLCIWAGNMSRSDAPKLATIKEMAQDIIDELSRFLEGIECEPPEMGHMAKIMALSKVLAKVCLLGGVGFDLVRPMLKVDFEKIKKYMDRESKE